MAKVSMMSVLLLTLATTGPPPLLRGDRHLLKVLGQAGRTSAASLPIETYTKVPVTGISGSRGRLNSTLVR